MKKYLGFLFLSVFILFAACEEETNVDNTLRVAFAEFNAAITDLSQAQQIDVLASRPAESTILVNIEVLSDCGGNPSDYLFTAKDGTELVPSAEGIIQVSVPAGETSTFFTVQPKMETLPAGAESLLFSITGAENAALNDTHLSFDLRVGSTAGFFTPDYKQNFSNCGNNAIPSDFFVYNAEGAKSDRAWGCRAVGNNSETAIVANAFGGEAGTVDAWLISKKRFDFTTASNKIISMDIRFAFAGEGQLEILWSQDYCGAGNPALASWNKLTDLESQIPENDGDNSYDSIAVNVPQLIGKTFYLAFRFSGATAVSSVAYEIDNLEVVTPPATGGGGGSGNGSSSLIADFNNCSDTEIAAGFTTFSVLNDDVNWSCSTFGLNGSSAATMNGFSGGAAQETDDWLITPSLDLTGTGETFAVAIDRRFDGPALEILYSTNYSGSGNPTTATWTPLPGFTSPAPSETNGDWQEIGPLDISTIDGESVYFAFRYTSGPALGASRYNIDNLRINPDGAGSGGGNGGGSGEAVSISDAKVQAGATVTISGIVTTPDYGFNNGQYFIQDETAGVAVYHAGSFGLVNLGDRVQITGTIGEFSGLVQISVNSLEVLSSGNPLPAAQPITASDLTIASEFMGSRVSISNVSLIDASQWPTSAITTGSGANVDATVGSTTFVIRIDRGESFYEATPAPTGSFTLTGILGRFNETVQIFPFVEGDIQ